jgi:predicted DNA-binding transcriptional regulator AlpA
MKDGDFGIQNRVLTSWKEIAAYLGKGVRTVQRWEKDFGLPVRRPVGSDKSAIIARTRDLDTWIAMRCSTRRLRDHLTEGEVCDTQRLMSIRSSLAAGVATAAMLRESNALLVSEVRSALTDLQSAITRLRGHRMVQAPAPPRMRLQTQSLSSESRKASPPDVPAAGAA